AADRVPGAPRGAEGGTHANTQTRTHAHASTHTRKHASAWGGDDVADTTWDGLVPPHGGVLVSRELSGDAAEEMLARARGWPVVRLPDHLVSDLICIGTGVYSPLRGFMARNDYWRVVDEMRLASGWVWSLPVVLPV